MSEERVVYHDGFLPPNVGTGDFEESLTRQSEAKDADINNIVARFVSTGILPVDEREQLFMDVTEVGDYRKVRDQINAATGYFMTLEAKVRAEFGNDPAAFLDFAVDPANKARLIELGVLPAEPVVPAPVVPAPVVVPPAIVPPKAS